MEHLAELEKRHELEMAVSEKGHLSIFSKANQYKKIVVNQIGWISNSSVSLVPQHSVS